MTLHLNCDLGETTSLDVEKRLMPYIHQANVSCGFHAGSPSIIRETLQLASLHNVAVAAHPGYPDRERFGRQSMALSADEIIEILHTQLESLDQMSRGVAPLPKLIKPHGALYNDMMADSAKRKAVLQAIAAFHRPLTLVMQATVNSDEHRLEALEYGIDVLFEAFADRRYDDNGLLLSRAKPMSVLDQVDILDQVQRLVLEGAVRSISGKVISLQADTLCLHGDNPAVLDVIENIHALVSS